MPALSQSPIIVIDTESSDAEEIFPPIRDTQYFFASSITPLIRDLISDVHKYGGIKRGMRSMYPEKSETHGWLFILIPIKINI